MSDENWSPMKGLGRAALSLVWRGAIALGLWLGLLWGFHAVFIVGLGIRVLPYLILFGFGLLAGSLIGPLLGRHLDERAGFVSPLLTCLAGAVAAAVVLGGDALFAQMVEPTGDHVRYLITGSTMVVALGWLVKFTLIET
ncbi:MAG: hypothetical protein JNL80_12270 [Phycisphaerae bacterium]|nr:hypothetical protein [Phycisphaerae bacterium]